MLCHQQHLGTQLMKNHIHPIKLCLHTCTLLTSSSKKRKNERQNYSLLSYFFSTRGSAPFPFHLKRKYRGSVQKRCLTEEESSLLESGLGFLDSTGVFTLPYLRHLKFTTLSNFLYYNLDSFWRLQHMKMIHLSRFVFSFTSHPPPDLPGWAATELAEAALLVEPVLCERRTAAP